MPNSLRLDELYKMTAHIYSEQNAHRPASATFAHFVEVCGFLTVQARKKKREEVTFEDALCKALGWYFPLMAKFKVASVEELIYRKYPYSCPYCRETPHVDVKCKTVIGTKRTVDHSALRMKYVENRPMRPHGINEWQTMFDKIYPRALDDTSRSVVGLFEELGELAEAVRVFDRFPKYFAGEAADVFSYLMGLANEYNLQKQSNDLGTFDLEAEFIRRYPGLCVQCGYPVCVCPLVPDSTVGRMAKELDIGNVEELFAPNLEAYRSESAAIAEKVLGSVGGYAELAKAFPFDRGEANHALVMFCLEAAERVKDEGVAQRLRSAALKVGASATYAGSPAKPERLNDIISLVKTVAEPTKSTIKDVTAESRSPLPASIGQIVIGELVVGDKYNSGTVGVQGAGAVALNTHTAQEVERSVDFTILAEELGRLAKAIMLQSPPSPEQDEAIESIRNAERSAKEKDSQGVVRALAKAGKWTFDVAREIGTSIAADVIKKSMNL